MRQVSNVIVLYIDDIMLLLDTEKQVSTDLNAMVTHMIN